MRKSLGLGGIGIINIAFLSLVLSSCSHLFYHPDSVQYAHPKQFKVDYQDVTLKTSDEKKLSAWHLKRDKSFKQSKGTIVFFHGNAQNMTSHFIYLVWATKFGYDVFIFDYRGYGISDGSPDQLGLIKDSVAALNYAYSSIHQKNKSGKFIVYGKSLGGVVAMRSLFDFKHKDSIDLAIMDSTFSSYQEIAFYKLKSHWLTFLFSPLAYILVSDAGQAKPFIPKLGKTPLLVIHGDSDRVVEMRFGKEVYKLAPGPKTFWKVPKGNHSNLYFGDFVKYREMLASYLNKL